MTTPKPKKTFPKLQLKYIDVPCCPLCKALPISIGTRDKYGSRSNAATYEEAIYACGFEIKYENGARETRNECGHLKDIMDELIRTDCTPEELLTSAGILQRIVGRTQRMESERGEEREKARQKELDEEARRKEEEYRHRKTFFGHS